VSVRAEIASVWVLRIHRYAMRVQIRESVISEDKRMQTIAAETIINIVM
jgi:hypothetical protein